MTDPTEQPTEVDYPVDPADLVADAADNPEVDDIEVPEPEESEWPEGTSPYDDPSHPDQDGAPEGESDGSAGSKLGVLAGFVRSGAAAIAWVLARTSWLPPGMCQAFTHTAFNVGAGAPSAIAAWDAAAKKHPTSDPNSCPKAVPVFFSGGSRGFGHACVSLGGGLVRSTDWPSSGQVGTARITDIERIWGLHFLGWTEDINAVTVWEQPGPRKPLVDASAVAHAVLKGLPVANAKLVKMAVVKEVGRGNMEVNHSVLGDGFRTQYALVQAKYLERHGVKVTKDNADGVPGITTLRWLGRRHGFRVRA